MKNYVKLDYLTGKFEKFCCFRRHLTENREDYITNLQRRSSQLAKNLLSL